ncbi:MAG: methyltransferase domain-containing protein [Thermoplasmata archaeon]|nr:methyltransferase domain-containing protein [Thermoplasmata archaeon]
MKDAKSKVNGNGDGLSVQDIIKSYDEIWGKSREEETSLGWKYDQGRLHKTILKNLKYHDKKEKVKILEVGCGKGDLTEKLAGMFSDTFALDISTTGVANTLDRTKGKVNLVITDATRLPFKSNFFDIIICSEVIEHIPEKKKVILEFNRIMCKGGALILTTPNPYSIRGYCANIVGKLRNFQEEEQQIINELIIPKTFTKDLTNFFYIKQTKGLVFNLPFMEQIGHFPRSIQQILLFSNRISNSIEERDKFQRWAQYLCFYCIKK